MKGVYIFLADGFEETEAFAPLDILRRGGVAVKTVAVEKNWDHAPAPEKTVTGAHGVPVVADLSYSEFEISSRGASTSSDVMIFPGGLPGAEYLAADRKLIALMQDHFAAGGTVAAICAAPGLVVSQLPDLEGRTFTCYDGFEDYLISRGAVYEPEAAVQSGNLITGRGPGKAMDFGFKILSSLKGPQTTALIRAGMLVDD